MGPKVQNRAHAQAHHAQPPAFAQVGHVVDGKDVLDPLALDDQPLHDPGKVQPLLDQLFGAQDEQVDAPPRSCGCPAPESRPRSLPAPP
jgi:hypothetical protein